MLKNILNLEGVTVLNKKQQGIINGGLADGGSSGGSFGGQMCLFTLSYHGGGSRRLMSGGYSSGSSGSSEANSDCVSLITANNDVAGCHYDCEYDGFGQ